MGRAMFVLVVEDEDPARSALVSALADRGCCAAGVRSIADAKRILRKVVPDVLVLDLALPDGRGEELLQQLRAAAEPRMLRLPVVVVSGASNAREVATGADAVFRKPVGLEVLMATIAQLATGGDGGQRATA